MESHSSHESDNTAALKERIGAPIKNVNNILGSYQNRILKPLGISLSQYSILYPLSAGGYTGAQLARFCFITPQSVTTLLHALEKKQLITRRSSPDHMHVNIIELTDHGRNILKQADKKIDELEKTLASFLTKEEHESLRKSLDKIEVGLKSL